MVMMQNFCVNKPKFTEDKCWIESLLTRTYTNTSDIVFVNKKINVIVIVEKVMQPECLTFLHLFEKADIMVIISF